MILRLILFILLMALPAQSATEQIVAGLSQNRVSITANFDGSEILIYGAVKRDAPIPAGPPMEVIVTVEGPAAQLVVRRKERQYGIWANGAQIKVDQAPSFYAIETTRPLDQILSSTEDLRYKVSIPRVIRAVGISAEAKDAPEFLDAMLRIREQDGRYSLSESAVTFTEETLFRADVELPANLTEGAYKVRIFLTRDGQVVDTIDRQINVRKEGMERFMFRMAHDQPLTYSLVSLLLALVAGWGASAAFRLIRL